MVNIRGRQRLFNDVDNQPRISLQAHFCLPCRLPFASRDHHAISLSIPASKILESCEWGLLVGCWLACILKDLEICMFAPFLGYLK